ncbi:MAG TPA: M14 family zinc carboxypeptidase [Micromonosporaceae bacterium]|nr:M14 family zinc carboxypeptidase [Micromonosporaceae bacterium]
MTALLIPLSAVVAAPAVAATARPHAIDFRDQASGAPPTGWSSVWRASEYRVQADPARLVHRATISGRQALSPDAVGQVSGDVEVAALARIFSTSGTQNVLLLHAGGAAGAENAYYVDFRGESGSARYRINRYSNGVFTTLRNGPNLTAAPTPNMWYQMVLQRRGDVLRFKVWPYGADEPAAWMIEVSDALHQGGRIGVGHTTGGDTVTEWAYLGVATSGSAPRAPDGIVAKPVVPGPTSVESRPIAKQISIGWDELEGANWYEVERDGELIASPWSLTAYADPLVSPGATARYRVRGVSALLGPGEWSQPLVVTAPPNPFVDTPTPFEASGGQLTTFEQEQQFLAQIDALSDRVAVDRIGTSVEGRPIHLARIGYPKAPDEQEIRQRPTLFVNCTVHGNEWTPRESCLAFIRDLALTEDPAITAVLAEHAVLVSPTANPDGRFAGRRENAQGLDVNRDYLALRSPEARAAVEVLNRYQPAVVLDGHNCCDHSVVPNWAQHANVGQPVQEQAEALVQEALIGGATTVGYTAQRSALATRGNATIMRNYSGLRNSLGLLNEVRAAAVVGRLDERSGASNRTLNIRHRAVRAFDFVLDATLMYFSEHSADISAAIAQATAEAEAGEGTVYFDEAATRPLESNVCGYLIPAEQYDTQLAELLRMHQITVQERLDGVAVSLAQAHRRLIPLLLDARADTAVADAQTRSYCASGDPILAPARELLAMLVDDERLAESTASIVASRLDVVENLLGAEDPADAARPVLTALIHQVEKVKRDNSDPAALAELAGELRRLLNAL